MLSNIRKTPLYLFTHFVGCSSNEFHDHIENEEMVDLCVRAELVFLFDIKNWNRNRNKNMHVSSYSNAFCNYYEWDDQLLKTATNNTNIANNNLHADLIMRAHLSDRILREKKTSFAALAHFMQLNTPWCVTSSPRIGFTMFAMNNTRNW